MIKVNLPFIYIETKSTLLVLEVREYKDDHTPFNKNKSFVEQVYYGEKTSIVFEPSSRKYHSSGSNNDYLNAEVISSTFGNGNNLETSLLIKNSDNTLTNRFFFKEAKILEENPIKFGPRSRKPQQILDIVEVDDVLNLELHTYYSILEGTDVITVSKKLINNGKDCNILRMYSMECPIDSRKLTVFSYDGSWLYERTRNETKMTSGVYKVSSFVGSSSHKHNPYIEVFDEINNGYYGFNLIYSGNHVETVEINPVGFAKVMTGLNDYGFDYLLKTNESFITPEAVMVYSKDYDQITNEMHKFVLTQVVNPKFAYNKRSVLFNSWEGCCMNIDEQSMVDMGKIAKEIGIELFVMDDGWFLNRFDDHRALGDWIADPKKFPNGLGKFSEKIHDLGLEFGIWVEPEMICIDSEIYRAHPEYAMVIPGREPIERRQQLLIDMANPAVIDYLFTSLSNMIDEAKPEYIKWDYNRFFTDSYSSIGVRAGEYAYRFMAGLYDLLEKLTRKYPDILIECCSSGGGRFDLGMLYYMPQSQGSDDTNTYCRSFISCGTLKGYPQSSYGAHVSVDGCPIGDRPHKGTLEDRFNLSCASAFGYEMDLRRYSKEELDIMKNQIEYFKKHRYLLQYGDLFICDNSFDDDRYYSYSIVSKDQKEAMFYISELNRDVPKKVWKMKGLNPNKTYLIKMRSQYNLLPNNVFEGELSGKDLMEKGLDLGTLNNTTDKDKYDGINSRLLYLEEK